MKQIKLTFLLTMLMCIAGVKVFAHDIEVKNNDGLTIYYNWMNNKTELSVSYRGYHYGEYYNEYSGNVVIPKSVEYENKTYSVTSIGSYAFYNCTGLTSVTIPNSVTSIGFGAFYNCNNLTSVNISDLEAWCRISFDSNPLSYAHHLFLNGKEVKELIIPNSVTSIGSGAFGGCTGLTSVYIPNSVTSIGDRAFAGCNNLTSVYIPNSVTSIGSSAFFRCAGLTSVTIPNSVTSIGESAFGGCSGLTSVTIPNSVTSIGCYAFSGCTGLTSVTIPNSVTLIDEHAFEGCTGLTSVYIPNSVTSIGRWAFYDCTGLTSVYIPNSVTSIGNSAFSGCTSLTSLYVNSTKPPILYNSFGNIHYTRTDLYVPVGSKDAYLKASGWKNFIFISEFDPTVIWTINNGDIIEKYRYSLNGQQIIEPKKGVNIIKMSDGSTKKVLAK